MPITLKSTGGGSVSIDVPSTGSTFTLTAPANNATIFTTDGGAITGNVAFTSNNITIAGQTIAPSYGMKNRIINGDMRIDQRWSGSSNTVNSTTRTYGVDRFFGFGTASAGVFTSQQVTDAPTGFNYSTKITVTTSSTPSSSQSYGFSQAIEGYNVADLMFGSASAKTVTLSFWIKSSLTGTFSVIAANYGGTRTYPATYSINASNTWEYKTITIPGDTTGTWLTNNSEGLALLWMLGTGSSLNGTANTWGTSIFGVSGQTNLIATNGATFYLTGVQLEVGSVATPFEFRQYGTELALCQRYFCKSYEIGTAPGSSETASVVMFQGYNSSGTTGTSVRYPVPMRTSATISLWDRIGGANKYSQYNAGWTDGLGTTSTVVVGAVGFLVQNGSTTGQSAHGHYSASAEL